jgi:hypothetical protein
MLSTSRDETRYAGAMICPVDADRRPRPEPAVGVPQRNAAAAWLESGPA